MVVLGTPGFRLEAVIIQGIIWSLNGLLTKVCVMQSQVWPGGGGRALPTAPRFQLYLPTSAAATDADSDLAESPGPQAPWRLETPGLPPRCHQVINPSGSRWGPRPWGSPGKEVSQREPRWSHRPGGGFKVTGLTADLGVPTEGSGLEHELLRVPMTEVMALGTVPRQGPEGEPDKSVWLHGG